ncbi:MULTISPECIES: EthD family reductase [unclassified Mameliella]|uniref:EthD family reductase n=1 Tax=unclassified Mameliella TaxID=2630630 RepID=UPI00273DDE11|nr:MULTISPECIES: EthD family reductase [unclassified Mameliella]
MANSVQVLYPATEGTHFDHDYYVSTHLPMVTEIWGPYLKTALATKGLSGGPDTPPGFHAIATLVFKDGAALKEGMGKAQPLLDDIPKFTDCQPQMLVGEVIG